MSSITRDKAEKLQAEGKAKIITSKNGNDYILGVTGRRRYILDKSKPRKKATWKPKRGSYKRFVENQLNNIN